MMWTRIALLCAVLALNWLCGRVGERIARRKWINWSQYPTGGFFGLVNVVLAEPVGILGPPEPEWHRLLSFED